MVITRGAPRPSHVVLHRAHCQACPQLKNTETSFHPGLSGSCISSAPACPTSSLPAVPHCSVSCSAYPPEAPSVTISCRPPPPMPAVAMLIASAQKQHHSESTTTAQPVASLCPKSLQTTIICPQALLAGSLGNVDQSSCCCQGCSTGVKTCYSQTEAKVTGGLCSHGGCVITATSCCLRCVNRRAGCSAPQASCQCSRYQCQTGGAACCNPCARSTVKTGCGLGGCSRGNCRSHSHGVQPNNNCSQQECMRHSNTQCSHFPVEYKRCCKNTTSCCRSRQGCPSSGYKQYPCGPPYRSCCR